MSSPRLGPVPIALLLATLSACGSEPGDPCTSVTPTVDLTGPAPVFNWTSTCPVASLDVAPSDSADASAWFVLGKPGLNSIFPPVTYGGAGQGEAVGSPVADSLVSGRQYRVTLRRTTGPAGIGLELVGQADFTAP
jgi:hypothetical protein